MTTEIVQLGVKYHTTLSLNSVLMKLVRLIKMCLNETYSIVHIDKQLSDAFLIENGLKQGDALLLLLFNFGLEYAIMMIQLSKKTKRDWN
jgi:hypothetical protein